MTIRFHPSDVPPLPELPPASPPQPPRRREEVPEPKDWRPFGVEW